MNPLLEVKARREGGAIQLFLIKQRLFGQNRGVLIYHFLPPIPKIMRMYRKILIMYMQRKREARIGWSIGNSAMSPPTMLLVIITRQMPKIMMAREQQTQTRTVILVKIIETPTTRAAMQQTRRMPIQMRQFPLQTKAQMVRTTVIPTVARTATGTTAESLGLFFTTIEQKKLMMYENDRTKISSMIISIGEALALGTQQATNITVSSRTMGITMNHA